MKSPHLTQKEKCNVLCVLPLASHMEAHRRWKLNFTAGMFLKPLVNFKYELIIFNTNNSDERRKNNTNIRGKNIKDTIICIINSVMK